MADDKKPQSFADRYKTDPEFRKGIDARQKQSAHKKNHAVLTEALRMTQGAPGSKKKSY